MLRGDPEYATKVLEESLARFRELGAKWHTATMLGALATIAITSNDHVRASALYEESLEQFRELGDSWSIAECLGGLGWLAVLQKDYERATELLEEALARLQGVGAAVEADYLTSLGLAAMFRGEHRRAMELMEKSLAQGRKLGDRLGIAIGLEGMAIVIGLRGQGEGAARLWGGAEALRKSISSPLRPDERRLYERYVIAAHALLDDEAWETAWTEGQEMTLEEAVDYALSEDQNASSAPADPAEPLHDEPPVALTRREEEVAALVARGLTNRQIAKELVISEHTAATHVARILKKLDLHSRSQLSAWMTQRSLLSPDEG